MLRSPSVRERARLSLVADPLGTESYFDDGRVEPGGDACPDAHQRMKAWMRGSSTRLHSKFFARDQIDTNQYTLWIIAALAGMVGILLVAGMGLLSTITAISSGPIPSTLVGVISPPLYVALLAGLVCAFVAILFMVHQAREPEARQPEMGFAGFAWNSKGSAQYLGIARPHSPAAPA